MKCKKCRHTVTRNSQFCPNCGERIVHQQSDRTAKKQPGIPIGAAVGLLAFGIFLGFAIFKLTSTPNNKVSQTGPIVSNIALGQNAAVAEIAQDFMCPCGTCNDPLNECTCEHKHGAAEVKGFIAQQLQAGHKKPHIVAMLKEKYAGLRSVSAPPFKFVPPPQ